MAEEFEEVFRDELGRYRAGEAHIQLKDSAKPKFCKARSIPLALRDQVVKELKRLEAEGIISPVPSSHWATPLVIVKKPNGSIRICGDFKSTLNGQLEIEQYPIPRPEDLFLKLSGGKEFTKIDLRDAYLQIPLDEESQKLTVINTPLGLFRYNRLPFGVASAAALFQRFLEQITAQVPGCINYLDDIVITGKSKDEHMRNIRRLLEVLREAGLRINRKKCEFFKKQITFLGHRLDAEGISPTDQYIEAIRNLPEPDNIKQLQAVIGKINYYNKFIPNFSTLAAPLNQLKKKGVKFQWTQECRRAFKKLKEQLEKATKLGHFMPGRITTLAADASEYGIGAVLSQKDENGKEIPIAFASKTLNKHQANYSQIDKEALAIVFGVKKFNDFLYGSKFFIITDHKPLVHIFNPGKKTPDMTAKKLQRWALFLSDYQYSVLYRSTGEHGNADALSRLPKGPDAEFDNGEEACLQIDLDEWAQLQQFPVDARVVAAETGKDSALKRVRECIKTGWPEDRRVLRSMNRWVDLKDRLSVSAGVVLLQSEDSVRVVIPQTLQAKVLALLHEGHWGMVLTKQLARKYCYWPGMDTAIERTVRECRACQLHQKNPPKDLVAWPTPEEPWERIHADYAGPFWGSMWLVVVDAKTGYPYAVEMKTTTSAATIAALEKVFVTEGLPVVIVSDNGTQFTSQAFSRFCRSNGVKHILAPPFHPQSNGAAERFVQTFKSAMIKAKAAGTPKDRALLRVLASYRSLPNQEGKSPAQLLHGRQPRTLLSLLHPVTTPTVAETPRYKIGDRVYIKNYGNGTPWIPAVIDQTKGSRLYQVRTQTRKTMRHQDQIRPRYTDAPVDIEQTHQTPLQERALGELIDMGNFQESTSEDQVSSPETSGPPAPRRKTRRRFAPYTARIGGEGAASGQDERNPVQINRLMTQPRRSRRRQHPLRRLPATTWSSGSAPHNRSRSAALANGGEAPADCAGSGRYIMPGAGPARQNIESGGADYEDHASTTAAHHHAALWRVAYATDEAGGRCPPSQRRATPCRWPSDR